ncbi:MAG: 50S ribosomal protein L24 [Clostridiales bacterium GWF2_38_85]|nr:MAG: 50S ribosomal protein L24 [Clostridiales bacterium GWF2_38_85]HBL84936.1 50S ribosomal protein L24 [Clostridiales bacterium]
MNKKLHIKTGDTVIVVSGGAKFIEKKEKVEKEIKNEVKDNKKSRAIGKVIATSPEEGKVIIEGINIVHKHVKPRKQGDPGGIIDTEGAMYACKVMLYCPKCDTGRRTKTVVNESGQKVRKCVKCGEIL